MSCHHHWLFQFVGAPSCWRTFCLLIEQEEVAWTDLSRRSVEQLSEWKEGYLGKTTKSSVLWLFPRWSDLLLFCKWNGRQLKEERRPVRCVPYSVLMVHINVCQVVKPDHKNYPYTPTWTVLVNSWSNAVRSAANVHAHRNKHKLSVKFARWSENISKQEAWEVR